MSGLSPKINSVRKVFDIDKVLGTKITKGYISRHYNLNKITYSIFHNPDFTHFSISRNGQFSKEDYLEAPNLVAKYIKDLNAKRVLELATGRGGSCLYLAQKFPSVEFEGVDLSETQLSFAFKKAKLVNNYRPQQGDFHNLEQFASSSFDIVFVIEALCYSSQKNKVFDQVRRVLKKKGVFIVFDAYTKRNISNLSSEELLAKKLVERGWALENFQNYQDFSDEALNSGFKIVYEEDVTKYLSYTLNKFNRLARMFFKYPTFAKTLSKILPYEVTYNAITGLLLPSTIEANIHCYYITVLKK